MTIGKRLFNYALLYKKTIIFALLMLMVAVAADLAGPFIAKRMIDQHILGIDSYPWYETDEGENAVLYQDTWYKREDHFSVDEVKGKEVRVLQVGRDYVFVDQPVTTPEGERTFDDGTLIITRSNEQMSYPAVELTNDELLSFYMPEVDDLFKLILVYFALLVVASIFTYGQKFYLETSANRIIKKMRNDVFTHIQKLPIKYFDSLPAGKIVSRITNDTETIKELFVTVLATFVTSIIYITGIYIALFLLDVKLALICLVLVPILVIWIKFYRKYASKYNHIIRSRLSDINAMINESIQGMTIIQAFRRKPETKEEFEEINKDYFDHQNKLLRLNSLTSHNLVGVLRNIAFVALIWYFGGQSLTVNSAISLGVLYAFVDYLNRLFQPITGLVNQLANLEQALVSSERVFELLDKDGTEVCEDKMPRYKGNVTFDKVSFGYKEGETVLHDISFEAKEGDTIALVGHTGSGKSSVMNLLSRFYDTKEGKILIDGQDINTIPVQMLRQHMAIVLQDPFLFTGTIASNVSLNDPMITREQVEKALRDVGADRLLKNLQNGYDEKVIEKGSTLSTGQRQLISFARALAFDPAVLILDEATANVDTETEKIIQDGLEVLKKGRTTFIIAHRLSTIKNANQILVLDRGRIVEQGNHDDLMQMRGKYYQMYQLQQGKQSSLAG
ncbi:ABC transporter ATP-binding protein [Cytobacillus sp. IB215316]|uniref:ABC transporter ATP-binding protein n=1 Tax=Cytobacillus sp. IB215316 TaxID=3097354 RepID=UPI002A15FC7D|nr:ABC transporter ATP-binding protein [Cytobacillus sp. IB215316]MDX8362013.1 ABC transporter ATP-binding protein [Cytobacillus sp. IB215316]